MAKIAMIRCPVCHAPLSTGANLTDNDLVKIRDGEVVLYLRGNVWQARYKLGDGAWHRISTKKRNLDDAIKVAAEAYDFARFREKTGQVAVSRRFRDVATLTIKQLEEAIAGGTGKIAYRDYVAAIQKYLIPYFGNKHIDKLDQADITKFEAWRVEKMCREPAASTVNNHVSAINRVFHTALAEGWMTQQAVPVIKIKGKKRERRPAFTHDEWRRVAANLRHWVRKADTERSRQQRELLWDYVLILANTGMRTGTEVFNLKWKQLRWHTESNGRRHLIISPSGKTGQRELVAREGCDKFFRRIQLRFPEIADLSLDQLIQKKSDEYVFRLRSGKRTQNLYHTFKDFLDEYGLLNDAHGTPRTLYSLRHTYATLRLTIDRIPIHSLAKQMGTSVQMLEQHYSHLEPVMIADQLAGKRYDN